MNFKDVAIKASKEAGKIHLKYFNKDIEIKEKSASYDKVTIVDTSCEEKIVSIIRETFPEHNILAEEAKYDKTDSPYTWVIDPLDGTNNFAHGIPIFSVSIALAKEGDIILGIVYDTSRDEMFIAEKGKGAFLNGKKITVSHNKKLDSSILCTGFYYDRGEKMKKNLKHIENFFLSNVVGIRRLGSAALDLCFVACGRFDGFWEFELNPWDFAAGKLLIEEAGGKVTDKECNKVEIKKSYMVASNSLIHNKMLEILNK